MKQNTNRLSEFSIWFLFYMKKVLQIKFIIPALIFLILIGGIVVITSLRAKEPIPPTILADQNTSGAPIVSTEVASSGDISSLSSTSISWPGEIISYGDAKITPSRDGQIAELYIKIGEYVSAGQEIGRLNAPSSTLELTSLLADKKQSLVTAKAQAKATKKLVVQSKKRLAEIEKAIYRSRDTSLDVAEKEAAQNSNTTTGASKELEALKSNRSANINASQAELAQSEAMLPIKFKAARASVKALSQRFAGSLSSNGVAPDRPDNVYGLQFNQGYGVISVTARSEYLAALSTLILALTNSDTYLPDIEATTYIQASLKLLTNTATSEQITAATMNNLRNIIFEDEQIVIEALDSYKEAQNEVSVQRAKLSKITIETDRDIIGAESNIQINDAFLATTESMKANQIAVANEEFVKEKAALDVKMAELNSQLDIANAEVKAVEQAYKLVKKGIGEEIRATQPGIISAIYVKIGDYVSIDTVVASTSSRNTSERFVRFRIPGDMQLPEVNEQILIERPGYPLQPKRARVVGVGLALDEGGSYQADAGFIDEIDWPVNSSVRVVYSNVSNFILVPFTAVWWDEKEAAHIWIVDTEGSISARSITLGRALGDRLEVEDGLTDGEKFISVTSPDLEEGMIVIETSSATSTEEGQKQSESMGGHAGM